MEEANFFNPSKDAMVARGMFDFKIVNISRHLFKT